MSRPRVVVVQRVLPHYRLPLFDGLRSALGQAGVDLELVYGTPDTAFASRADTVALPWARAIDNREIPLGPLRAVWQPCLKTVTGADLVIVEQASRLLLNYLLMAGRRAGGPRLGIWGHGRNRSATETSPSGEWLKRTLIKQADWWFAYTTGVADYVASAGFDPARITALQNTIDTEPLRQQVSQARASGATPIPSLTPEKGPLGMSLGSLYPERRLDFLIDAAARVRSTHPEFQLVVVGDGASRPSLEQRTDDLDWVHVVGALRGPDLAAVLARAQVMMNPGVVGLNVLDAFASGVPMATTSVAGHGPEIDYIEHGVNGLVLSAEASAETYADAVANLLSDETYRTRLIDGGTASAGELTIENMVERFVAGIEGALGRPRRQK